MENKPADGETFVEVLSETDLMEMIKHEERAINDGQDNNEVFDNVSHASLQ